jgi:hypothetical protein
MLVDFHRQLHCLQSFNFDIEVEIEVKIWDNSFYREIKLHIYIYESKLYLTLIDIGPLIAGTG